MISWGEYQRDPPYTLEAYCGHCHKVTTHYFRSLSTTLKQDAYACSPCHALIYVQVRDAPNLAAVIVD